MPGVQKPHCRPCSCQKPSWIGWSLPSCSSPSTVSDLAAVGLDGEHRAGLHRLAVEQDGAGAAVGGVAADVGAGQAQVLAQEVDQQQARLDLGLRGGAVDGDLNRVHRHGYSPPRALDGPAERPRGQHPRHLPLVFHRAPPVGRRRGGLPRPARRFGDASPRRTSCPSGTAPRPPALTGVGPALVSPMPRRSIIAAVASSGHLRRRRAVAKSPTLRSSLT